MIDAVWYLRTQDETFGPVDAAQLVEWAKLGRIQPGQEISDDNETWRKVEDVSFLDMRFSIDIGDGNPRGPFHYAAAQALLKSGRLPPTAVIVESRPPFKEEAVASGEAAQPEAGGPSAEVPSPAPDESRLRELEALLADEQRRAGDVRAQFDDAQAKLADVQAKLVDAQNRAAGESTRAESLQARVAEESARVRSLQERLAEEESRTRSLQGRLDEAEANVQGLRTAASSDRERLSNFESALKEATDRENKYLEQVHHLEDELRRLPQAASEVADIQAAVYSIMTGEAEELGRILDVEKREFEEFKRRHADRLEKLAERRRELVKRAGANIEDMTRKALVNRPEDPRTTQLRKDLEDLRRVHDHAMLDKDRRIADLEKRLRDVAQNESRAVEGLKDITQLRQEAQTLREQLQLREKELIEERTRNEDLRRQQATRQQTLMARIATLESPSIGTANSLSTNQSREAKLVKLPGWMRLGHG